MDNNRSEQHLPGHNNLGTDYSSNANDRMIVFAKLGGCGMCTLYVVWQRMSRQSLQTMPQTENLQTAVSSCC